jgi:hypothetical protein
MSSIMRRRKAVAPGSLHHETRNVAKRPVSSRWSGAMVGVSEEAAAAGPKDAIEVEAQEEVR